MSKVVLVIPCYNEADRLNIQAFQTFLKNQIDFHLLFVNDGSTDRTLEILTDLSSKQDRISHLNLEQNGGKAEAVRRGILHANETFPNAEYYGFLDADLATPLEEITRFHAILQSKPTFKIALGSRWKHLGAHIERSAFRHYMGRIFATLVSMLFKLSVYDTQCGAKLMRNVDISSLFSKPFVSAWFFDIEILCRYKAHFKTNDWAVEIPLNIWREIGGSRIKMWDFITAPLELLKIKRHYN